MAVAAAPQSSSDTKGCPPSLAEDSLQYQAAREVASQLTERLGEHLDRHCKRQEEHLEAIGQQQERALQRTLAVLQQLLGQLRDNESEAPAAPTSAAAESHRSAPVNSWWP